MIYVVIGIAVAIVLYHSVPKVQASVDAAYAKVKALVASKS